MRECVELEESYGTVFVENICKDSDDCPSGRYMKETIYNLDREALISNGESRGDTALVARIEKEIGWCKLWDLCRDHGPKSVVGLRAFLRIIVHPFHANKCCPKCDIDELDASLLSHVIVDHSTACFSNEELLTSLFEETLTDFHCFFTRVHCFYLF